MTHRALVGPPMIIDSFAGGGGASTGIELALGRSPDVAINHSAAALALHAANHPDTLHLDSNIWDVDPLTVTQGRKVGLLWASPDCKHFSKAKGGAPRDRNIRDLAWVVVRWAEQAKPDVIAMENVEEFVTWGPVDNDGQPIREFAGQTFELWISRLKKAGYRVQWRELRACDYGAPTIRKRWFLVARRDGRSIIWPKPTHGDPKSPEVSKGKRLPWRTAAECIDWSIPCPSIFATEAEIMADHGLRAIRPLARNTLARVARGVQRYVLDAGKPFLVSLKGTERRDMPADHPHPTVLAGGGHSALIAPSLAQIGYGEAPGQLPRVMDISAPLGTIVAGASKHALIAPHLVSIAHGDSGGRREYPLSETFGVVLAGGITHALVAPVLTYAQHGSANRDICDLAHTIAASRKDQNSLFAAFLAQQNGGPRMKQHAGHDPRDPISTIAASGSHQTPVAAFFAKYYGTGDGARHDDPMHTVTVKDRFAHTQASLAAPPFAAAHHARARAVASLLRDFGLWEGGEFVTLAIDGTEFVIVDIGLRMLSPRELFNAQGFPPDYVIEGVWQDPQGAAIWKPFTKNTQVSACGNSVCPQLAAAIIGANCGHLKVGASSHVMESQG